MPGLDGTSPYGNGPMTGGRRGYCNPASVEYGPAFLRRYGYGRGFGRGLGFRRGYGPGLSWGHAYGRDYDWYPPAYRLVAPMSSEDEILMLNTEANAMKTSLDAISNRIAELEIEKKL